MRVESMELPLLTTTLAGETDNEKSTPVPLRDEDCGLPLEASSVTVSVPVRVPGAVGVNVMFTLQFALGVNVEPQLLVCAKSREMAMLTRCKVALPVLLRVTPCEELVVEIL